MVPTPSIFMALPFLGFTFSEVLESNYTQQDLQFPPAANNGILAEREDGGFTPEPDAGRPGQAQQG